MGNGEWGMGKDYVGAGLANQISNLPITSLQNPPSIGNREKNPVNPDNMLD